MGFRFRKSVKAGPFRINFSKSGVGYSFGGKGARVTKKAGGGTRTTLSLPGTGLSYVTESGSKKKTASGKRTSNSLATRQQAIQTAPDPAPTIKTALFHIVGLADHTEGLKKLARSNPHWNLTPDQILSSGKEGSKIFQLAFINNPVELKEEISLGVSIAVFVAGIQIGYIAPEETASVRKLLQRDLIRNMVCIINGGTYKVADEFGEIQTGKQRFVSAIKVAYRVPAAAPAPAASGIAATAGRSRRQTPARRKKTPFYKRWWFWAIAILLLLGSCGTEKDTPEAPAPIADTSYETEALPETTVPETTEPVIIQTTEAPTIATTVATEAPIVAPAPVVEQEENEYTYVLNTSSKKFHELGCSSVSTIKAKNRKDMTTTREKIIAMGYTPCKRCYP